MALNIADSLAPRVMAMASNSPLSPPLSRENGKRSGLNGGGGVDVGGGPFNASLFSIPVAQINSLNSSGLASLIEKNVANGILAQQNSASTPPSGLSGHNTPDELDAIARVNVELVDALKELQEAMLTAEAEYRRQVVLLKEEVVSLSDKVAWLQRENEELKARVADDVLRERQTKRIEVAHEKARVASMIRRASLHLVESTESRLMEAHDDMFFSRRSDTARMPMRQVSFVLHFIDSVPTYPLEEAVQFAMEAAQQLILDVARTCGGYHVSSVMRCVAVFAFHSATAALRFARQCHLQLLATPWTKHVTAYPAFAVVSGTEAATLPGAYTEKESQRRHVRMGPQLPVTVTVGATHPLPSALQRVGESGKEEGTAVRSRQGKQLAASGASSYLYAGPRLRTCVFHCDPGAEVNPVTGDTVYYGPEVKEMCSALVMDVEVGEIVVNESWCEAFCSEQRLLQDKGRRCSSTETLEDELCAFLQSNDSGGDGTAESADVEALRHPEKVWDVEPLNSRKKAVAQMSFSLIPWHLRERRLLQAPVVTAPRVTAGGEGVSEFKRNRGEQNSCFSGTVSKWAPFPSAAAAISEILMSLKGVRRLSVASVGTHWLSGEIPGNHSLSGKSAESAVAVASSTLALQALRSDVELKCKRLQELRRRCEHLESTAMAREDQYDYWRLTCPLSESEEFYVCTVDLLTADVWSRQLERFLRHYHEIHVAHEARSACVDTSETTALPQPPVKVIGSGNRAHKVGSKRQAKGSTVAASTAAQDAGAESIVGLSWTHHQQRKHSSSSLSLPMWSHELLAALRDSLREVVQACGMKHGGRNVNGNNEDIFSFAFRAPEHAIAFASQVYENVLLKTTDALGITCFSLDPKHAREKKGGKLTASFPRWYSKPQLRRWKSTAANVVEHKGNAGSGCGELPMCTGRGDLSDEVSCALGNDVGDEVGSVIAQKQSGTSVGATADLEKSELPQLPAVAFLRNPSNPHPWHGGSAFLSRAAGGATNTTLGGSCSPPANINDMDSLGLEHLFLMRAGIAKGKLGTPRRRGDTLEAVDETCSSGNTSVGEAVIGLPRNQDSRKRDGGFRESNACGDEGGVVGESCGGTAVTSVVRASVNGGRAQLYVHDGGERDSDESSNGVATDGKTPFARNCSHAVVYRNGLAVRRSGKLCDLANPGEMLVSGDVMAGFYAKRENIINREYYIVKIREDGFDSHTLRSLARAVVRRTLLEGTHTQVALVPHSAHPAPKPLSAASLNKLPSPLSSQLQPGRGKSVDSHSGPNKRLLRQVDVATLRQHAGRHMNSPNSHELKASLSPRETAAAHHGFGISNAYSLLPRVFAYRRCLVRSIFLAEARPKSHCHSAEQQSMHTPTFRSGTEVVPCAGDGSQTRRPFLQTQETAIAALPMAALYATPLRRVYPFLQRCAPVSYSHGQVLAMLAQQQERIEALEASWMAQQDTYVLGFDTMMHLSLPVPPLEARGQRDTNISAPSDTHSVTPSQSSCYSTATATASATNAGCGRSSYNRSLDSTPCGQGAALRRCPHQSMRQSNDAVLSLVAMNRQHPYVSPSPRRQLCLPLRGFLYCDIVGAAKLLEEMITQQQLDPGRFFEKSTSGAEISASVCAAMAAERMSQLQQHYHYVVRSVIRDTNGIPFRFCAPSGFAAYFSSPLHALEAALGIQNQLLHTWWPDDVAVLDASLRVRSASTGELLFSGLRVGMAVHCAECVDGGDKWRDANGNAIAYGTRGSGVVTHSGNRNACDRVSTLDGVAIMVVEKQVVDVSACDSESTPLSCLSVSFYGEAVEKTIALGSTARGGDIVLSGAMMRYLVAPFPEDGTGSYRSVTGGNSSSRRLLCDSLRFHRIHDVATSESQSTLFGSRCRSSQVAAAAYADGKERSSLQRSQHTLNSDTAAAGREGSHKSVGDAMEFPVAVEGSAEAKSSSPSTNLVRSYAIAGLGLRGEDDVISDASPSPRPDPSQSVDSTPNDEAEAVLSLALYVLHGERPQSALPPPANATAQHSFKGKGEKSKPSPRSTLLSHGTKSRKSLKLTQSQLAVRQRLAGQRPPSTDEGCCGESLWDASYVCVPRSVAERLAMRTDAADGDTATANVAAGLRCRNGSRGVSEQQLPVLTQKVSMIQRHIVAFGEEKSNGSNEWCPLTVQHRRGHEGCCCQLDIAVPAVMMPWVFPACNAASYAWYEGNALVHSVATTQMVQVGSLRGTQAPRKVSGSSVCLRKSVSAVDVRDGRKGTGTRAAEDTYGLPLLYVSNLHLLHMNPEQHTRLQRANTTLPRNRQRVSPPSPGLYVAVPDVRGESALQLVSLLHDDARERLCFGLEGIASVLRCSAERSVLRRHQLERLSLNCRGSSGATRPPWAAEAITNGGEASAALSKRGSALSTLERSHCTLSDLLTVVSCAVRALGAQRNSTPPLRDSPARSPQEVEVSSVENQHFVSVMHAAVSSVLATVEDWQRSDPSIPHAQRIRFDERNSLCDGYSSVDKEPWGEVETQELRTEVLPNECIPESIRRGEKEEH